MRTHTNDPEDSSPDLTPEPASRTRRKKQAQALQQMGERLAGLSDGEIGSLGLPGALSEALHDLRTMKSHGARRRQMQYIGALMREVDTLEIEALLEEASGRKERERRRFQLMETWRDALVSGDTALLERLAGRLKHLDRQRVLQLVRNAQKESEDGGPSKSGRALFRCLRDATEDADLLFLLETADFSGAPEGP